MRDRPLPETTLELTTPMPAPHWALLERRLMAALPDAIEEFYAKYFDERGYLLCYPRWGALDGPDDAAENVTGWTELYALGGPERVLELYRQGIEGHMRQYTEARTVECPLARDGMYYKEFRPASTSCTMPRASTACSSRDWPSRGTPPTGRACAATPASIWTRTPAPPTTIPSTA